MYCRQDCHPQSIALVQTRGSAVGLNIEVGDAALMDFASRDDICGVLVQYPNTYGVAADLSGLVERYISILILYM